MALAPFATKIPSDLKRSLDAVCNQLGLKKSYVIETALREKLEDLLDAHDLKVAQDEATGFHSWEDVKKIARSRKKP